MGNLIFPAIRCSQLNVKMNDQLKFDCAVERWGKSGGGGDCGGKLREIK
jgi:hypothetical protein